MANNLLIAERGCVYEWQKENYKNLCLVISAEKRCSDKLVSILFLTTDRPDRCDLSDDVVHIFPNGDNNVVRTDLITYTNRAFLKRKVGIVSKEIMAKVDAGILRGLGLNKSCKADKIMGQWLNKCDELLSELRQESDITQEESDNE